MPDSSSAPPHQPPVRHLQRGRSLSCNGPKPGGFSYSQSLAASATACGFGYGPRGFSYKPGGYQT